MKKKNLEKMGGIIKSINNTIQAYEKDGVLFDLETTMDRWQHDLFLILCDEQKGEKNEKDTKKNC